MTITEIIDHFSSKHPISRKQVYRFFKVCKPPIKPMTCIRLRPQQYPPDAVQRIEVLLGLSIVSMKELRDVRHRAKHPRVNGRRHAR
jgi:hypothetical protein